jgi:hypothetical protein
LVKPDGTDLVDIAVINSNYDKIDANIASTKIQATKPATANAGDLWWDSNTGTLYLYYTDVNSSQWVAATSDPVNIGVVANQSERDAQYPTPGQGMSVYRTDLGLVQRYYGLYNASTNPGGKTPAGWYVEEASTPVVPSQAARDAKFSSPNQGDTVFRNDLGHEETYYGLFNASTNPGGRETAGWYKAQTNVGLVPIVPSSVTYVSGTGSVTANGEIAFTNCTKVEVNGVFSSAFKNYRIIYKGHGGSANQRIAARFRTGAGDYSGAAYSWAQYGYRVSGVTYTGSAINSQSFVIADQNSAGTGFAAAALDLFDPFTAGRYTIVTNQNMGSDGTNTYGSDIALQVFATDQFSGISFYPLTGNTGGIFQVFGYND